MKIKLGGKEIMDLSGLESINLYIFFEKFGGEGE